MAWGCSGWGCGVSARLAAGCLSAARGGEQELAGVGGRVRVRFAGGGGGDGDCGKEILIFFAIIGAIFLIITMICILGYSIYLHARYEWRKGMARMWVVMDNNT